MQRSDGQAEETRATQSRAMAASESWDGTAASNACVVRPRPAQRMLTRASLASVVSACLATLFTLEYVFVRVSPERVTE